MKKVCLFVIGIMIFNLFNSYSKIFVIGDSTVSSYSDSYYPRTGWGQVFQEILASVNVSVAVDNLAVSGRSSKSFYDEDRWTPIYNQLSAGDYVFIQFGHNDEKIEDLTRGTDPFTTFQDYLSIYIDQARSKGAYPVLVTPMHRNYWSNGQITDSHGDYAVAIRELAAEKSIPLVDLHEKSKSHFESKGQNYTSYTLFMNFAAGVYSNYPDGSADNTHFQETGAREIAQLVIEELQSSSNSEVQALMGTNVSASLTKHGAGSSIQTVEINTPISEYYYSWAGASTVQVTGLPSGVTATINNSNQTVTIGGSPTVSGIFNITVTTVGGSTNATVSPLITVTEVSCSATTLTSYVQVNGGSWNSTTSLTVLEGGDVVFGPQPTTGGSWSWSGPQSFNATTREVELSSLLTSQAGTYSALYTNSCGAQSTLNIDLSVESNSSNTTMTIQENQTGFCGVDGSIDNNNAGFSGEGFANTSNALAYGIDYKINIGAAGNYSLEAIIANGSTADRPANILVDGSSVGTLSMPSTGSWSTWFSSTSTINLSTGTHDLRLEATTASGLANVDYITISGEDVSAASCNEVSVTTLTIQENETGYCSVDGSVDNNNSGYTGSGFANTDNAFGNGVSWTVNIPSSGNYNVAWRYANGGSTDRTAQIMVNGITEISNFSMPTTGSWVSWGISTATDLNLPAGNNIIRLEATNSSGLGNIDYLEITGVSPQGVECIGVKNARSETENTLQNVNVYPVPASNYIHVELQQLQAGNIYIYNSVGKMVLSHEISSTLNKLDISNMPCGLYNIVIAGNENVSKVFIKK